MASNTNEIYQHPQHNETPITEQEKGPTVLVRSDTDTSSSDKPDDWNPSFWARFPYTGIGALIGIIICSIAATLVIYYSNGKAKSQWKLHAAPNVLVNIFTAISSILVTMAVGEGIAISWWRKAMKGATVEDLHKSWSFGSSMMSLVTGWKFWNVMALTALCTKFAIIDSTLFQKALSTQTALGPMGQIQAPVLPLETFPYTGVLNQDGNVTAYMTYAMTWDSFEWTMSDASIDSSYLNGFYECAGLCDLTYRGVGFESICTMTNVSAGRTQSDVESGASNANTQMSLDFQQRWPAPGKNYSWINMEWLSWSSDYYRVADYDGTTCPGRLINLTCELRPSVIDYPVALRNSSYNKRDFRQKDSEFYVFPGTIDEKNGTLNSLEYIEDFTVTRQVPNFNVVRPLDVYEEQVPGYFTQIGGIAFALQSYYKSLSTASYDNQTYWNTDTNQLEKGLVPVVSTTGLFAATNQAADTSDFCPIGYDFDYNAVLQSINTLMILVSDDVFLRDDYNGTIRDYDTKEYDDFYNNNIVNVNTVQFKDETYYVSRMAFAYGALASTILVVLLIIPSYWGFWQLGRKVTLGPFEIANAFDAPAFSHVHRGAGHVDGVIAAVGQEKVQYGAQNHEVHGTLYGFKRPGMHV